VTDSAKVTFAEPDHDLLGKGTSLKQYSHRAPYSCLRQKKWKRFT